MSLHLDEFAFVLQQMGYIFNRGSLSQAIYRHPSLLWPAPATVTSGYLREELYSYGIGPSKAAADRAALWIREVAKVRPIQVTWKFLSLAKINEAGDYARDSHTASHATFPLLARARAACDGDPKIAATTIYRLHLWRLARANHRVLCFCVHLSRRPAVWLEE